MGRYLDIKTGMKYNLLTIIKEVDGILYPSQRGKARKFYCSCDCGNTTTVKLASLRNGTVKSCGCLKMAALLKRNTRHGHSKRNKRTRLNRIWLGMKDRCSNPNNHHYKWYGGKGITVCEYWLDYINFLEWAINNGYADNLSIDRINSNIGYEPNNCRWVTLSENSKSMQKERKQNANLLH